MKKYRKYIPAWILTILLCLTLTGCGSDALEEGTELLEVGSYKEAVKRFKEAAEREKDAGEAYRGIGMAKWEMGEYEAARNAFEAALENGAEKTAALYNFLGSCELKLGNSDAAVEYFGLGQECEDASEELMQEMRFNEIAAYEQLGEWDNAYARLTAYVKDYPGDERAEKEMEFLKTQGQSQTEDQEETEEQEEDDS